MSNNIRLSAPALRVLKLFVEKPREPRSGAEISRATAVGAGTLYPLLARLEHAGWFSSEWEQVDPAEAGRPRRRFYRLTAVGQAAALKEIGDIQVLPGALAWNS